MSATFDEDFDRLAQHLVERLDRIAAEAVERIREAVPEWTSERPQLDEVLRSGARASIEAELVALRDGAVVPSELPQVDAEGARLSARSGFPLDRHLFLYRAGHAVQWSAWFDIVEAEPLDVVRRRALLDHGSTFFFQYADRLSQLATEEHQRERERLLRSHEQRRVHIVRQILDGEEVDPDTLDYPIAGHHIAVVAAGSGAVDAVRGLAEALDRRLLLVELLQDSWWVWLGGREPVGRALGPVLAELAIDEPAVIALGNEGEGPDGFRRSHRQASQAHQIAIARGDRAVRFEDVALEALAWEGVDDARYFVGRELRGIDGDDSRSTRLRATLDAYFAHNQNAAATAAALGVHEQTVAKRLLSVEERTGRAVADRRAELELALRLRRCLPDQAGVLSSDAQR